MTTSTAAPTPSIADTILAQLGGHRFIAMTGTNNFLADTRSLSFKLPRGTNTKATHVVITLDADDTYTVEFVKCSLKAAVYRQVVKSLSMVYCDQLQRVFTSETGLLTRL